MVHSRFVTCTAIVTMGAASSACLTDITWGDRPDPYPAGGSSLAGDAGAGAPGSSGAGGAAGHGAGGAAASTAAALDGGVLVDGGVPDGGNPAEGCGSPEPCLEASPFPLPAPCAGVRYSAALAAIGGTPPLTWSRSQGSSAEFVLDTTAGDDGEPLARIESTSPDGPTLGGVVQVRVEDSSTPPQRVDITLDLRVRQSCWFAYLSDEGSSQLHLRDVFLEHDVLVAEAGANVLDFRFSPDGSWLAFRQRTPEGDRLYTYAARAPGAGGARAIPLTCTGAAAGADAGATPSCDVLDYAWSDDSNQLAFVVSGASAASESISGVSGFVERGEPSVPWPARATATWVNEEVSLDYREQLRWLGSDRIAFLGDELSLDDSPLTMALYTAEVEPSGLGAVEGIPPLLTPSGTTLLGGPAGALLVEATEDSESSVVSFYSPGEIAMYHTGWLSPSNAFVGWATEENALELYDVHDDASPVASSGDGSSATGSCESILAWSDPIGAGARERIACAAGSALEFFEYDPGATRLDHLARVIGEVAPAARRAFSPDGRWFVFGSAGGVRFELVDLSAPAPRLDLTPIQPLAAPVELLYPPTRAGLVNLADSASVIEYPLPGGASWPSGFASEGASPRAACVEAFWMAPADWCGAPRAARHLAYAGDSQSLLFEDAPGRLSIAQPGADARAHRVSDTLGTCSGSCPARPYAFQP